MKKTLDPGLILRILHTRLRNSIWATGRWSNRHKISISSRAFQKRENHPEFGYAANENRMFAPPVEFSPVFGGLLSLAPPARAGVPQKST